MVMITYLGGMMVITYLVKDGDDHLPRRDDGDHLPGEGW
jgi:hypothetical protein